MKIDPDNVPPVAYGYDAENNYYLGVLGDIYNIWLHTPYLASASWEVFIRNKLLNMSKLELAMRGIELEIKRSKN